MNSVEYASCQRLELDVHGGGTPMDRFGSFFGRCCKNNIPIFFRISLPLTIYMFIVFFSPTFSVYEEGTRK